MLIGRLMKQVKKKSGRKEERKYFSEAA